MAALTNAEGMAELCFTGLGPKIELSYKSLYHVAPTFTTQRLMPVALASASPSPGLGQT